MNVFGGGLLMEMDGGMNIHTYICSVYIHMYVYVCVCMYIEDRCIYV